jgi:hypothetical protein
MVTGKSTLDRPISTWWLPLATAQFPAPSSHRRNACESKVKVVVPDSPPASSIEP